MAQITITDLKIKEIADQTTYQEVFEQAAYIQAWTLLATTLADANITNRALEKKRDYCKRLVQHGLQSNKKLFVWTVLSKLRDASTTIDDTDILEKQADSTTPGFDKLKTGADAAFEVMAGIQSGDESQPVVNSDAQEIIFGSGAPTLNAEFKGQEYLDETGGTWYKAITTGTGSADWLKL